MNPGDHRVRLCLGSAALRSTGELRRQHPRRHPAARPGSDGINGVRLANAIHLSSWTGREVSLAFDEDEYLAGLNQRIRDEGTFAER